VALGGWVAEGPRGVVDRIAEFEIYPNRKLLDSIVRPCLPIIDAA
jgi:hypothetical protein